MAKLNEADLDWETIGREAAGWRRKRLADAAEGEQLGGSLYELPPGRRSWPYHFHTANEEALFVLEGTGTLRLDGQAVSLNAGDYVALPADERGAHQVVNDGTEPLRYLMLSTMIEPDVAVYPDSGKFGVFAGAPPGSFADRVLEGYYRIDATVDYWAGEEDEDGDGDGDGDEG